MCSPSGCDSKAVCAPCAARTAKVIPRYRWGNYRAVTAIYPHSEQPYFVGFLYTFLPVLRIPESAHIYKCDDRSTL